MSAINCCDTNNLCALNSHAHSFRAISDCRKREQCAGWARLTFNRRESSTLRCQFINLSQQKCSVLIETQVRQESFSALWPSVSSSVNCKVHQKLKSSGAPQWHDTLGEKGKESHQEMRQKLAGSPGSFTLTAEPRWASTAESVVVIVPIPTAHKTPILAG